MAPHQAKPGHLSGGVTSIKEPPVTGFARRDSGLRLRATFRRQEIRSPPDRSQFEWRARAIAIAQWAPWEVTAAVAIFSLGIKTLRLKKRSVNTKATPQ
ncbi:MAG TPA: hypothetical protein VJ750_12615 [Rhizomicrobium sp.]|nr:hypothetical protein [Rhizomicrobium sp.]